MIGRPNERAATDWLAIDAWMARRIAYFGKPCLTMREYEAVAISLKFLPDVRLKDGETPVELEPLVQAQVAPVMGISQPRVSQLLSSAAKALLWFEAQGTRNVGWFRLPYGRGAAKWEFRAPVLSHPIPPDPTLNRARVEIVSAGANGAHRGSYKLVFGGAYNT